MKRFSLFILFLTIYLSSNGQPTNSKELIAGRWNLIETIKDTTHGFEPLLDISTDDPETVERSNPKDTVVVFFFTPEGEFQDVYHGRQYRYEYRFLSDDVVIIGDFSYKILLITSETLKMRPYMDDFSPMINRDILIFQKSDEPFELIKEFEKHLIYYGNGRKKEEGEYHNGIENGVWKEWYLNGQQKSQKVFTKGTPIGIWKTWDETGKLLKEENRNIF